MPLLHPFWLGAFSVRAFRVPHGHLFAGDPWDAGRMARLPERLHPLPAEPLDGRPGLGEIGPRVKILGMLEEMGADRCGHSQAVVGVDVDLADAGFNRPLDLGYGDAPRLPQRSAIFVDGLQEVLGNGRRAVHDKMGLREAAVDLQDPIDHENIFRGLFRKLVRAMACADGDG